MKKRRVITVGRGLSTTARKALEAAGYRVRSLGFDDSSTKWRLAIYTNESCSTIQNTIWNTPGLDSIWVSVK